MKKKIAALTAILCLSMIFGGCSNSSTQNTSEKEDAVAEVTESSEAVSDSEAEETSEPETSEQEEQKSDEESTSSSSGLEIEKSQVLWESNGIKVTTTEVKEDDYGDTGIGLLIENDGEQNVIVFCEDICVNGYGFMGDLISHVASGKKSNEVIPLEERKLNYFGVEGVESVDVWLRIVQEDSYDEIDSSERISVNITKPIEVTEPEISGAPIFDQDGYKVWCLGYGTGYYDSKCIKFYAENSTDKKIFVMIDNFSANGFMMNTSDCQDVFSHGKAYFEMDIYDSYLKENSITDVTDAQFTIRIVNSDDDVYGTICESGYIDVTF